MKMKIIGCFDFIFGQAVQKSNTDDNTTLRLESVLFMYTQTMIFDRTDQRTSESNRIGSRAAEEKKLISELYLFSKIGKKTRAADP